MPTGQTVVSDILNKLGLLEPNGTPGASDSVTVLQQLNIKWDAWSIDEGLIYAIIAPQFPLSAFKQSYSIGMGAGADWQIQRPARIYSAAQVDAFTFSVMAVINTIVVPVSTSTAGLQIGMRLIGPGVPDGTNIIAIVANTSITLSKPPTQTVTTTWAATGLDRNELDIVEARKYLKHNDLGASATTCDEVYPNYNPDANGNMEVRVWPVVNGNQLSYLELQCGVAFAAWVLSTNYNIPPGYQDAIEWTIAFDCLPIFGVAVAPQVAQVVAQQATKAEARIREMNARNRQTPPQTMQAPGTAEAMAAAQASKGQ